MVGEVVITPRQKLEDLIRLAELCVDLLRQNEEFYAEVILFLPKWKHFKKLSLEMPVKSNKAFKTSIFEI